MTDYTKEALGQVVRSLRERNGKTQEELGREAGYKKGAGVSISRLESGLLRPGSEMFAGIAKALGLKPEELEARAAKQTAEDVAAGAADAGTGDGAGGGASEGARASRGSKELKELERRIQHEIYERTTVLEKLSKEFNRQHDRARDEFFMRFVEVAALVEGAPQPDSTQLQDADVADADAVAAYRLRSNANGIRKLLAEGVGGAVAGAAVGSATAYRAFVAAVSFGTAPSGAATSGLFGAAATNAALALGGTLAAGGAGVAMVLGGIFAAPSAILFAVALHWGAKRNRKQQQELAAQLDEAEAQLAAAGPGYRALQEILPRASGTLDYIATHAGHALNRWKDQLGPGSMTWESLGQAGQQRYQSFSDIAAAQVAIVTIDVQGVLTTRGDDRDQLIQLCDEVLTQAQDAVKAHV